jgi:hypothetical protein
MGPWKRLVPTRDAKKQKKKSLYYQSDFKLRVKWVLTHYIVFFLKKNRGP